MANVRLTAPFAAEAGAPVVTMQAPTVGELCQGLAARYGGSFLRLLDSAGSLSRGAVVLVDRRNAHTLQGARTPLTADTEVLIMPLMSGG